MLMKMAGITQAIIRSVKIASKQRDAIVCRITPRSEEGSAEASSERVGERLKKYFTKILSHAPQTTFLTELPQCTPVKNFMRMDSIANGRPRRSSWIAYKQIKFFQINFFAAVEASAPLLPRSVA